MHKCQNKIAEWQYPDAELQSVFEDTPCIEFYALDTYQTRLIIILQPILSIVIILPHCSPEILINMVFTCL